ncbi:MOB kinase activator-like 2 [Halotydeus destructor]|nr:MOB kinase activator-like 2 [Halotydeus destructor]
MKVWFNCSTSLFSLIGKARRKDKDVTSNADESKSYLEATILECIAPEYRLREIVDLPEGVHYNEWIASHTLSFFDHINLVYGTISEYCTMSGCPEMSGPSNRQYAWIDEKGKRFKLSAPQYIDYVMTYTQKTVNDESVFPTKFDRDFPSSFESNVKRIIRLLFHVLAHIYHTHFKEIVLLNLHSHLNCIFAHLVLFNDRFKLVDEKEVEILEDLAVALKLHDYVSSKSNEMQTPSVTPEPMATAASCAPSALGHPLSSSVLPMAVVDLSFSSSSASSSLPLHQQQHTSAGNNECSSSISEGSNSKENVITEQCRSISPFINNNFGDASPPLVNQRLDEGSSAFGGSSCSNAGQNHNYQVSSVFRDPNDNNALGNAGAADLLSGHSGSSVFTRALCDTFLDNQVSQTQNRKRHKDNTNLRASPATAILFTCSSEPSLPTASLNVTRRSQPSGTGEPAATGHGVHPYNNYQVYHRYQSC